MSRPGLRVVAFDLRGSAGDLDTVSRLIREAGPDVAVLTGAPWRLRTRTHAARLADRSGLVAAAGSAASVGNVVLVNMRVNVHDTWAVQFPLVPGKRMHGAVLVRCSVGSSTSDGSFVVAATRLSVEPGQRRREADILSRVLSEVDDPLVLAGDVADTVLGQDRVEASGNISASPGRSTSAGTGPGTPASAVHILVGPGIGVQARHYARRGRSTAPIMVDLLLPGRTVPTSAN
jgi:hypothetical protein